MKQRITESIEKDSPITPKVANQILSNRNSGETNMFDIKTVQCIANREGFHELVMLLEEYPKDYIEFILKGNRDAYFIEADRQDDWFTGSINGYAFEAKVCLDGTKRGIYQGCILCLCICDTMFDSRMKQEIVSYDGVWDAHPTSPEIEEMIKALDHFLATLLKKENKKTN